MGVACTLLGRCQGRSWQHERRGASQAHRCSPLLPEYQVQEAVGLLSHLREIELHTNKHTVFIFLFLFFLKGSLREWKGDQKEFLVVDP